MLVFTRGAVDPVGWWGAYATAVVSWRRVPERWRRCPGQLDAALAQVVALQAGLVGSGEYLAGDVLPAAFDRGLCERDDWHPVIGAEPLGHRDETGHAPGGDVQVGDVLKRLVSFVAQSVGAQFVREREHEPLGVLGQFAAELSERSGLGVQQQPPVFPGE